jgi:hypothetical protein
MAKRRTISEPLPQYRESPVKTGWCSGVEEEKNHAGCPKEFHSMKTNTKYTCSCECH